MSKPLRLPLDHSILREIEKEMKTAVLGLFKELNITSQDRVA